MSDEHDQTYLALYLAGAIPVVWIALLLAPYLFKGSVFVHLSDMTNALNNPLSVTWTEDSLKTIFLFLCIYMLWVLESIILQKRIIVVAKNMVQQNGVLLQK